MTMPKFTTQFLFSFLTLTASALASPLIVFHEVDVQQTFWESMHGAKAGPLAVPGSKNITANIALIKKAVYASKKYKAVASMDFHLPAEIAHPETYPEFKTFGSHAKADLTGPEGPDRIPEVELFRKSDQVVISHHEVIADQIKLVNVNPEDSNLKKSLLNPKKEIIIQKNASETDVPTYSVFSNPRTESIYKILNPKAIFVYGVATDYCVHAAVTGFLKRGYTVYVLEDAIAGIAKDTIEARVKEMKKMGAIFIKTEKALQIANYLATH